MEKICPETILHWSCSWKATRKKENMSCQEIWMTLGKSFSRAFNCMSLQLDWMKRRTNTNGCWSYCAWCIRYVRLYWWPAEVLEVWEVLYATKQKNQEAYKEDLLTTGKDVYVMHGLFWLKRIGSLLLASKQVKEWAKFKGCMSLIELFLAQSTQEKNTKTVNKRESEKNTNIFFHGVWCLPNKCKIQLKDNTEPVIHPARKVPEALKERL